MAQISYGFSLDLRLVKLVPVNYCFFNTKTEFLHCSLWTIKHLMLLVVSCCRKFEGTWSGKCLGRMCLLLVGLFVWLFVCLFVSGRKNVSVGRAAIDPLTVWYINFSVWSRRLCSNVLRLGW